MTPTLRLAAAADAPAIRDIYAPYVQDTVISFELEPPTLAEMAGRLDHAVAWLVAEAAPGDRLGYAYASKHKERAAYRWSVDVSVYLDGRYHRRGVGRALYTALFALLRAQGYVNAYAGVTQPNAASMGLHTALGFELVGVYKQVGYKFGRWHDVAWLSLALQPHPAEPASPRPLGALPADAVTDALAQGAALLRA